MKLLNKNLKELDEDLKELVLNVVLTSLMVKNDQFIQSDTSLLMRDIKKICLYN